MTGQPRMMLELNAQPPIAGGMRKVLQEIATETEGEKLYRFVDLDDERDAHRAWYSTYSAREKAEAAWLRRHPALGGREEPTVSK